ncbi:hypothetical protein AAE478_000715 [Parahypoxylon ruwenzoriense]
MSSKNTPVSVPPATRNIIIDGVLRFPPTGLRVLIVGAGVGGMMAALECWRKGMEVEIVEKSEKISTLGDVFTIGPSALTTFHNYPTMLKEYDEVAHDADAFFATRDYMPIVPPQDFEWNREGVAQSGAYPLRVKSVCDRPIFANMLFGQCKRLGIPINFGATVKAYQEDIAKKTATVVTQDGQQFTADIVIAADGIGTISHAVTLGHPVRALKTGFISYRTRYSTERLKGVLVAEDAIRNLKRSTLNLLGAHRTHCVFSLTKDWVSIVLSTEEDDDTAIESWSSTVSNEHVLSSLPEPDTWYPLIVEILRHAPEQSFVRWSLCFRDPQPRWTSAGGNIVQLGDSAHSFLPTSGNGATQALEDALSLPECLRLGGKDGAGIATKVHELLRYQRVSLIQHTGFVNMQTLHREFDAKKSSKADPPVLMGKWLWAHNAEKYATENFAKARAHVENGAPFENTNLPAGHKWQDWTMESEIAKQRAGIATVQELRENGDWSLV